MASTPRTTPEVITRRERSIVGPLRNSDADATGHVTDEHFTACLATYRDGRTKPLGRGKSFRVGRFRTRHDEGPVRTGCARGRSLTREQDRRRAPCNTGGHGEEGVHRPEGTPGAPPASTASAAPASGSAGG